MMCGIWLVTPDDNKPGGAYKAIDVNAEWSVIDAAQ
jgi:hypothetical protein